MTQPSSFQERRGHRRLPLKGAVTFLPGIGPEFEGDILVMSQDFNPARILDISEGGIRLEFTRNHWPHPIVRFRFDIVPDTPIIVYAKLIWNKKNHSGFRFIVLSDHNRFLIRNYTGQ